MPTPNAASLGKYGDIPVSFNTGVQNIGIPIHTLTEGGISLPISLSYHAGGIKVGEPVSWVGQNWSLQAGGMISRTVQGRADESCGGFFSVGKDIAVTTTTNPDGNSTPCIKEIASVTNNELANGVKDGEPDIFSFSVGGYNGKFYIAADLTPNGIADGQVVLIPKQDVKITYTASTNCSSFYRLQKFTVITPDGVKYEFGSDGVTTDAIEITGNNSSSFKQASGWYLKKITSADGANSITLNYIAEKYRYSYKTSSGTGSLLETNGWPLNSTLGSYPQNGVDVGGFRLDFIQTSTEKVTFVAGADRTLGVNADLAVNPDGAFTGQTPKSLGRIKVENGTMCKDFILFQSYFQDNNATHKSGQYTDFRLRLDSIQEKSCDATTAIPPHKFTYYSQTGNVNYLPNRLSSAIDHWGYSNGALTNPHNGTNIPYTRLRYFNGAYPPNGRWFNVWQGTSDRETNEASMLLGTIKQITYPTGGNTVFEYEANTYWDTDGIKAMQDVPASTITKYFPDALCGISTYNPLNVPTAASTGDLPARSFTASELNNTGTNTATMFYKLEHIGGGIPACTVSPIPEVQIYAIDPSNVTNTCIYTFNPPIDFVARTQEGALIDIFPCLQANVNYIFVIRLAHAGVRFSLKKEVIVTPAYNRKVGGLRIKKMTNNDAVNVANDVVKTYQYGTTISTGTLYNKPVYGYALVGYIGSCIELTNPPTNPLRYFANHFFMDQSIVPLGGFEGSHLNYSAVQENYVVGGVTQYYSVYNYYNEAAPGFNGFPITPQQPRIGSGELTRTEHYKNGSTTPISWQETTTNTEMYEYSPTDYIKFNTYQVGGSGGTPISFWKNYRVRNKPYRLSQMVSYLDGVTTTTNYTYAAGLLPKRSETVTNSNSASTTSTYYYASDDPTNYSALIARNMIGFPMKVKQKTGNAVRWSKVEYDVFNGSTQIEPKYLKESFEDIPSTWITRVSIAAYTTNGLPSSVIKNNFSVAENYAWTNKLLTQKTFGTGANLLTWGIAYKAGTNLVEKVTDENGLIKKYAYDPLMRLQTVQDRMKDDGTDVQTTTNYTYQYKDANNAYSYIGTSMSFANTTDATPLSTKQYMDGLGRAVSVVKENYTHSSNLNQINNVVYDALGRQYRTYLPFASNMTQSSAGYVETGFEGSPLSRPISQRNPDGTYKYMSYGANTVADAVQIFTPTTASGMVASAASSSTYAANMLYKTMVTDENGKISCVFKDKLGRVILTRKFLNGGKGGNEET
ncbi:MAG: DUF6443 domain-containing protein [Saprospiraceae bacterium]|nr:DUF6443 domain-containing protein [Saprospiraceae bacterium]